MGTLRRVLVSGGAVALCSLSLFGLVAVFGTLVEAKANDQQTTQPAAVAWHLAPVGRVDRELCVVADGQQLRARFELQVGSNEALVAAVRDGTAPGGRALVTGLFGEVSAAQFLSWPGGTPQYELLTFMRPRLVAMRSGTAWIQVDSDPYMIGTQKSFFKVAIPSVPLTGEPRKVTVDVNRGEIKAAPLNAQLGEVVTHERMSEDSKPESGCQSPLRPGVIRSVYLLSDTSDSSLRLQRERTAGFWASDIAGTTIPVLDPLLWLGINAVPYVLAAWYLRRSRLRGAEARSILLCVAWLLIVAGLAWSAEQWFDRSGWSAAILVLDSALVVGALAWLMLCWAFHPLQSPSTTPRPNPTWAWLGRPEIAVACVIPGVFAAVTAGLLGAWSTSFWAGVGAIAAAAALGVIVASCLLLVTAPIGAAALPIWVMALGVTAVGATAARGITAATSQAGGPSQISYLFAVLCLAGGGAILALRSLREWLPQDRRVVGVGIALAGYLLLLGGLVLPRTLWLLEQDTVEVGPWTVPPFANDLSGVLYVIVLVSFIAALRCLDARAADARSMWLQRSLGVVFVVLNFYWYEDRWLYLPVPVLVGWALAVWWLLPPKHARTVRLVRRKRRNRSPSSASARAEDERLLQQLQDEGEQLLQLVRAERRHQGLLAAGHEDDFQAAKRQYDRLRREATQPPLPLDERFFGIPDGASPWRLGVQGTVLGTLLGIPWMVVFLTVLIREGFDYGTIHPDRYPWLWMFSYVFGTLTQWSLYGFFLGYFFPYLRGKNAVAKALALFVTLTIPTLLQTLLWWRDDWIPPTLWWILQLLGFLLLLGMLLDYRIAKSAGADFSAYREVRGVTTILGWSGAGVAALITAVITLIQSTAALYVQNLLHLKGGGP